MRHVIALAALLLTACGSDPSPSTPNDAAADAADALDVMQPADVPDASPPADSDATQPADVPAPDVAHDAAADAGPDVVDAARDAADAADVADVADVPGDAADPLTVPASTLSMVYDVDGEARTLTSARCTATGRDGALVVDFGAESSIAGTVRQIGTSVFGVGTSTTVTPTVMWGAVYDLAGVQRVNVRVRAVWMRTVIVTVRGCPVT